MGCDMPNWILALFETHAKYYLGIYPGLNVLSAWSLKHVILSVFLVKEKIMQRSDIDAKIF